ncbi:autoinducer binding domain-containing protein [Methylocystis echinoides]|uniref:autoinducer binding domain-containing protein n=1 Tax=Methylocystis echinoides TaxID=29468 RepID=UPI003436356E
MRQLEIAYQDFVDGVRTASDASAFRAVAERAAQELGFRWFAYLAFTGDDHRLISTYPKEWTEHYRKNRYDQIDPVIRRARRDREVFRWSGEQATRGANKVQQKFYVEAAAFGIEKGVSIPLPAGFDRFAVFTFASDKCRRDACEGSEEAKVLLRLMATYFHAHVEAALRSPLADDVESPLSQREAQCLSWLSRGRTIEKTACIMNIKPRTVAFHIDNARAKLGAENVTHTVALAIKRGLIP